MYLKNKQRFRMNGKNKFKRSGSHPYSIPVLNHHPGKDLNECGGGGPRPSLLFHDFRSHCKPKKKKKHQIHIENYSAEFRGAVISACLSFLMEEPTPSGSVISTHMCGKAWTKSQKLTLYRTRVIMHPSQIPVGTLRFVFQQNRTVSREAGGNEIAFGGRSKRPISRTTCNPEANGA